ncbi:AraC family transcriptional regulator [Dyadobacter sp. 3J3]|uniref:helix-turn-helix domain-containing protein n=1 Tax=Dyadobacter sp. 3J3 TaxID=2606600 RepID=UPI001359290C|nr:helix-turn-helix domain-containing protein [Dyadobacter sp. 3J3]
MLPKKQITTIHKHAELMQSFSSETDAAIVGFSVNLDEKIKTDDFIEGHFRTDYMVICVVTSGFVTFSINLKKYNLITNGLILAPPNALKQLVEASPEATVSIVSFTADFLNKIAVPNLTADLFEYFSSKFSPYWNIAENDAEMVLRLMGDMHNRKNGLKGHPFGKELLYTVFQTFLYEIGGLSKIYAEPVNPYFSRKENLAMEFMLLVQKNFRHQRSVSQYAEQLNITPKYLTETIKELTGKNAGEIIDNIVMLEARFLLGNPSLSISETANLLNFNDQSFFGKFFKRHEGISPKKYRSTLQ